MLLGRITSRDARDRSTPGLRGGVKAVNDPAQSAYDLNRIADGSFDAYIDTWATEAAAWGHPVLIRLSRPPENPRRVRCP